MEVVRTFSVTPPAAESFTAAPFVSHLSVAGTGIIAAVSDSPVLHLYHTETLALVQETDITHSLPSSFLTAASASYDTCRGKIINNKKKQLTNNSEEAVSITALAAGPRDQLWVGTSVGLVLTLPLPRMACGLPMLGQGWGHHHSRHAHRGPVRLVLQVNQEVEVTAETAKKQRRVGDGQPRIPCLMVPPPPEAVTEPVGGPEESTKVPPAGKGTQRMRGVLRRHENPHHHHHPTADKRASKTLPRGFSLSGYRAAIASSPDDEDDEEEATAESMLQLYGELVNVRDYDCTGIGTDFGGGGRRHAVGSSGDGHHHNVGDSGGPHQLQQQRHSSDPDLAAIPYRVSTLDRRISMKLQRARSLDLSSWSLGSRTSSWTTSSSSGTLTHSSWLSTGRFFYCIQSAYRWALMRFMFTKI
jgi:Rho guanine nucleotide exchange factor 10